jgi:hypothetical protein
LPPNRALSKGVFDQDAGSAWHHRVLAPAWLHCTVVVGFSFYNTSGILGGAKERRGAIGATAGYVVLAITLPIVLVEFVRLAIFSFEKYTFAGTLTLVAPSVMLFPFIKYFRRWMRVFLARGTGLIPQGSSQHPFAREIGPTNESASGRKASAQAAFR